MDRNKVYEYFAIQNDLKDTIIMWFNKAFHKKYKNISIEDIKYISGGMISVHLTYEIDEKEHKVENYEINIKDLENV